MLCRRKKALKKKKKQYRFEGRVPECQTPSIFWLSCTLLGGSGDLVSGYFKDYKYHIPIRVPFRVLISLLITYLLSPPTLQVDPEHETVRI